FAADRSSVGLQLPLNLDNATTSVDNEFNDMMSSVGTTPTLLQNLSQQFSFTKPSSPPNLDNNGLVKPKGTRFSKSSRTIKIKNSQACSYCQKSKVKCNYLDNNPCERCAERGLKCSFYPPQKRGPKPGKKNKSDTQNLADFRKLNRDFTQKANKLGFNVHTRIVAYPNNINSNTQIPNHNTALLEKNLIMAIPELTVHPPPLPILSPINCENSNNLISILDDQRFFMNNEVETDPSFTPPYLSSHQN
ncbi:16590_t:CDS:1, partial [Gigaspora rosea]